MNTGTLPKSLAVLGVAAATVAASLLATEARATPDRNVAAVAKSNAVTATRNSMRLPRPLGAGHQTLAAGVQVLDLVSRDHAGTGPAHLPRIAITLPSGWFNYDGWGMSTGGPLPLLIVSFWDVNQVYPTPCHWKGKTMVDPGSTVNGLVSALAKQPLRRARTPRDVVLAGFAGKYLQLSVPGHVNFADCDEGYFETWTALGWGSDRYQQGPGQIDRIWILNVKGQRLVIDAAFMPQATGKDRAELDRVVHSIRFGAAAARRTPSTGSRGANRLDIANVTVSDINNSGQIVGGLTRKDGSTRGFVWQNGSPRELGQGRYASADKINNRGQIIGSSSSASNPDQHAVLWEKGRMADLGIGSVTAINEHTQIIGSFSVQLRNGSFTGQPVIWENGKARDLWKLVDGSTFTTSTSANAINNRGQVVGQTSLGRAVRWQNGKTTDLGPGTAVAINEHSQIAGYGQTATGQAGAFLWQNGKITNLGPGWPVAINERGQIAGYSETAPGKPFHAFLWQNGTTTDLGTLGGNWSIPTAISNRGQVVGYSTDSHGVQHGFVWQNGTMTRLGSPTGDARTRALAINDHNQIIGDNCYADCGLRRGPLSGSKFAVLWTIRPHRIDTLQLLSRR